MTMARILVAEDEDPLRALVARAITDLGHTVVTAFDGADVFPAARAEMPIRH